MIGARQTAYISAWVVAGGLVLGWMLARTSSTIVPVRVATAEATRVQPVSAHAAARLHSTDTHSAVSSVPAVSRPAQPVMAVFSTDSLSIPESVTTKPPTPVSATRVASKAVAITSSGFAPLPLPALKVDADTVSVGIVSIPAVLAAGSTAVALSPVQKTELEKLANDFAEHAGEPPADLSEGARSDFAVNAYIAATEADFLIRQRYGHRAYVQMQMEAHRASLAP